MARQEPGSTPSPALEVVPAPKAAPQGKKKKAGRKRGAPASKAPAVYFATGYPGPARPLPPGFARAVLALEKALGMPMWLLVQNGTDSFGALDGEIVTALFRGQAEIPAQQPVAVLIHSVGGQAKAAYEAALMLRRRCGKFTAVVPCYAKSAATLLSLAGEPILLGIGAELGPLDVQFLDPEREDYGSALNDVQALERLHVFALDSVDRTMNVLLQRTPKKVETLLPMTLRFVTDMTRPLFEKIDSVRYTQRSRALKVAEEYAVRLLVRRYGVDDAKRIARHLVEHYPDHDFLIDADEAERFGLRTTKAPAPLQRIMDSMTPDLFRLTAVGRVKEVSANGKAKRR